MTNKIYSSLLLSVVFHSLFLVILMLTFKKSVQDYANLTYVSLIQETTTSSVTQAPTSSNIESGAPQVQPNREVKRNLIEKTQRFSKAEEHRLEERIAALRAKKNIIDRKATEKPSFGTLDIGKSGNIKGETVSSSYLGLISGLIRKNWSIPETLPKNLEAVVSVRILQNGQIVIEGFEKSSGNSLFDSSVVKALRNSSPLPPPKNEVVVGLRFKP